MSDTDPEELVYPHRRSGNFIGAGVLVGIFTRTVFVGDDPSFTGRYCGAECRQHCTAVYQCWRKLPLPSCASTSPWRLACQAERSQ